MQAEEVRPFTSPISLISEVVAVIAVGLCRTNLTDTGWSIGSKSNRRNMLLTDLKVRLNTSLGRKKLRSSEPEGPSRVMAEPATLCRKRTFPIVPIVSPGLHVPLAPKTSYVPLKRGVGVTAAFADPTREPTIAKVRRHFILQVLLRKCYVAALVPIQPGGKSS